MQAIEQLKNHVIICGFGRNGQQAALTLKTHKEKFVVIENNINNIDQWLHEDSSLIYINGDATDDDLLIRAGIKEQKR